MSLFCANAGKLAEVRHPAPENFWKARGVSLLSSSFFLFHQCLKLILSSTGLPPLPPLLPKPAFDLVLLASERNHLLVKGQAVTKECR